MAPPPVITSPIAAASAASTRQPRQRRARWALARVEGRRLLMHPVFVLAMATSGLGLAVDIAANGEDQLTGLAGARLAGGILVVFGAGLGTFVAASLAASRERRDGAQDFYVAQPVTPRLRTQAALLSLGWAGLASAALIAVATVAVAGLDGAITIEGQPYALRPLELAQGPLYLVLAGAVGVLIGCWSRSAYPTALGALLFVPPMTWGPYFVFGDGVPKGFAYDWLDNTSVAWHLVGLTGLILLAAGGALARHDRRPRVVVLAIVGLCATIAGLALGFADPPPGGYGLHG